MTPHAVLLWWAAWCCACGGKAVVDGGRELTPCELACEELSDCLATPSTCVTRCEQLPEKCADQQRSFLRCALDAHGAGCNFSNDCGQLARDLFGCVALSDDGVCEGDADECYCDWVDSAGDEYTYACVGSGCSCYDSSGFHGSCTSSTLTCGDPLDSCCGTLQALAGIRR